MTENLQALPARTVLLVALIAAAACTAESPAEVTPPAPTIVLSKASVDATVPVGAQAFDFFDITNGTPGSSLTGVTATVSAPTGGSVSWLSAGPNGPTVPMQIFLTFDAAGLSPGTYQAAVVVSSSLPSVAARTLPVSMTVVAASPARLTLASGPSDLLSGVDPGTPFSVRVVDADGNLTPSSITVSAELASGTGALAGVTSATAVGGVATFSQLRINGRGAHRLRFVASAVESVTSAEIAVTQRVAGLVVIRQPAGAAYGQPFTTQPQLELRDDAGLVVADGSATVIASRVSGAGALFGQTSVAASNGLASFADLAIEGAGAHRLAFATEGVGSVESDDFTVSPGAPGIRLKVGESPETGAVAGEALELPVVLDLSNRGGDNLGSLSVRLTWDPVHLTLTGSSAGDWVDGSGSNATVVVNADSTAAGVLRIAGFTTEATLTSFVLRHLQFAVSAGAAGRNEAVTAAVTAAGNALGTPVAVTPRPATVIIAP